jgi:carbamoyltransferase
MPINAVPFMNMVVKVLPQKRSVIPAVTHVDGSARVQTVSNLNNLLFKELLEEFYRLTGVPILLNTSFNVRGEPIVCTPEDAIRCFYSTGLDSLFIGNYLVEK